MSNFSKALKLYKTKQGLSNKSLAKHLGIDESLVSRLLNGKRQPTSELLNNVMFNYNELRKLKLAYAVDLLKQHGIKKEDFHYLKTTM